jgi:UDP-2,3-diacylglucosamine pyrophosphatase LpxH
VLVFISDLHLRPGTSSRISRAARFESLWQRIAGSRRDGPVRLCLVGDIFDLVRAPDWLRLPVKPYHPPSPELAREVAAIVARTLECERDFAAAIRSKVEEGALEVHYLLGNHDRLLAHAPDARALIRHGFGMPGGSDPFPTSIVFREEGVLAYHGHNVDALCHDPSGAAPLGDLVAAELIVPFPDRIRRFLGVEDPHLDDIDDVRPVLAVPSWVRQLAREESRDLSAAVLHVWRELVESFLENPYVKDWFLGHHRRYKLDFAQRVRLLLALSARAKPRDEPRLGQLYYLLFRLIDVRFARAAVEELEKPEHRGLSYVVNGHTHFAAMKPLGLVGGRPACYFNTGTWRTLHQLGNVARGRPAFVAYDAAAYLVFFGRGDPLGRTFEWWQGATG